MYKFLQECKGVKVGVLGGTFNPIHFGHLLIAEHVRDNFQLDRIYFIPTHFPPHKNFKQEVTDKQRLEMIQLACEDNPYFFVSDMELRRGGVSYTIDTIKEMYDILDIEGRIYFIIGGDLVKDLPSWKNFNELKEEINIVAVDREDQHAEDYKDIFPFLDTVKSIPFFVTSTRIRNRIKNGKTIKYLVPNKVEQYILSNQLYKGHP